MQGHQPNSVKETPGKISLKQLKQSEIKTGDKRSWERQSRDESAGDGHVNQKVRRDLYHHRHRLIKK